jgi:hypothetical protein
VLGVHAAGRLNGIFVNRFTLVLGTAAILFGGADVRGTSLPVLSLLLIVGGASILWRIVGERTATS